VAVNDQATTAKGAAITIDALANDKDTTGATICAVQTTTDKGGKAAISNGKITYTPCSTFCGTDTFTYSICKTGCDKSTATVTIVVNCPCPVAVNDQATTAKGAAITIDALANDKDTTGASICAVQATTDKGGKAAISNGKITYTPCSTFCGTDTFTYSICRTGCDKSTATVTVTITCPVCPVAVNDQVTTAKGAAITIDALANDKDTTGAAICCVQATTDKGGKAAISNGKITYTPAACFCGTDTFTYSICKTGCDKSTATVTVTVTCPVCPVAVNDQATTTKGVAINIDALANDKDTTGAAICCVQATTDKGGKAAISNGKITYTPAACYYGTDTFTYSICKTGCDKSTATVTVTVNRGGS
jgi:folate-dependent phosphoribosylglycinamide formyltransferase PurN